MSPVNTANATQTMAKPATRGLVVDEDTDRQLHQRGQVLQQPDGRQRDPAGGGREQQQGTAVAILEPSRTRARCRRCRTSPARRGAAPPRTTIAGTATSSVSTNSPGAASVRTIFFIRPYRANASVSAIQGGRPSTVRTPTATAAIPRPSTAGRAAARRTPRRRAGTLTSGLMKYPSVSTRGRSGRRRRRPASWRR